MSTLAGHRVSSAVVRLPRHGVWAATVHLVGAVQLAGAVSLTIEDLTLAGSVVRGGPDAAASTASYTITGGAGGWRKPIPSKPYRNDLGVKLSTVLSDAARDAGERLELGADRTVGPAYVRRAGPAWDALALLASSWWVDVDGVTQVRPRPAVPVIASYRVIRPVPAQSMREIATESPALFAPGALFHERPIEEVTIHVDHASLRLLVRT